MLPNCQVAQWLNGNPGSKDSAHLDLGVVYFAWQWSREVDRWRFSDCRSRRGVARKAGTMLSTGKLGNVPT